MVDLKQCILNNWPVLFGGFRPSNIELMKIAGRPGSRSAVCFLLFVEKKKIPSYFLKVSRDPSYFYLQQEFKNLSQIYDKLSSCKATVPKPIFFKKVKRFVIMAETVLSGKRFDRNLFFLPDTRRKKKATRIFFNLSGEWLQKFHQETQSNEKIIDDEFIENWAVSKISTLFKKYASELEDVKDSIYGLIKQMKLLRGTKIPIVSVHGDFDHWNILMDKNSVRVIDWEDCYPQGLPFIDLFSFSLHFGAAFYPNLSETDSCRRFFAKNNWTFELIDKFYSDYFQQLGIDQRLIYFATPLFIIEMIVKEYPSHRVPTSFPVNSVKMLKTSMEIFGELVKK